MRIYYQDTDAGGVVFHGAYLHFFERARMDWMRACGFDSGTLAGRHGVVFIVRQLEIAYLKPALLDDLVSVSAGVTSMGRAQLTFAQQVRRGADILVRAAINVACVAADSLKPVAFPEEIRASLDVFARDGRQNTPGRKQPRRQLNRV